MPPPNEVYSLHTLVNWSVANNVGVTATNEGLPQQSWSNEALAQALVDVDPAGRGVDVRTVQLWLSDKERGINSSNIRLLSRVFGCGDEDKVQQWLTALLEAKHRNSKNSAKVAATSSTNDFLTVSSGSGWKAILSLSSGTERLFSTGSPTNLSIAVFCGAVSLGVISGSLGMHDVTHTLTENVSKQVGFLWAPNWSLVFLIILPIYLLKVCTLVQDWVRSGRLVALTYCCSMDTSDIESWADRIKAASFSYWAIFIACVPVMSGFNWIANHVSPIIVGETHLVIDWSRIALSEASSVTKLENIIFTGLTFTYMAATSYLFFAALLTILIIVMDLRTIFISSAADLSASDNLVFQAVHVKLMDDVFRCTVLGLFITILIKAQSTYLLSTEMNILEWFWSDLTILWGAEGLSQPIYGLGVPALFNSFISCLAILGSFFFVAFRIDASSKEMAVTSNTKAVTPPWRLMYAAILILFITFLVAGIVPGFSYAILLSIIIVTLVIFAPTRSMLNI